MIRITYTHYCDKCLVQLQHEKVEHRPGVPLLQPDTTYCAFGMILCNACHEKVAFAVREAFA